MPIAQKRLVAAGRWSLAAAAVAAVSFIATPRAAHADVAAVTWGFNYDGQLGNGTDWTTYPYFSDLYNPTPGNVTGLSSGVTAVTAGCYGPSSPYNDSFSLALVNGGLVGWGYNGDGELGVGQYGNSATSYGEDFTTPQSVINMSSGVTAIAGGGAHTLAIKGGLLYASGDDNSAELGNGTFGASTSTFVPVSMPTTGGPVTAIAAGNGFSLAVQGGAMYAWGYNYNGLGNGTTFTETPVLATALSSGVTAIAAGQSYGLAIQGGQLYAWGKNSAGLGNTGLTASSTPVQVAATLFTSVTSIAAGGTHILAVQNGNVYAWGGNGSGQLGNGTTTASPTPQLVTGITGTITQVAASASDSYALSADGSIWDWGANNYGQLGLGTSGASQSTPQHLTPQPGYAYTSVASNSAADSVVATLAHPNSVIAASAVGTSLGTVSPTAPTLVLSSPTISGSVQIGAGLSNTIYLKLDNTSQAAALVTDLNYVYGTGTASKVSGGPQVALTLPTSGGSPSYFNFDFTTVVNAGSGGNTVGSVAIDEIDFTSAAPEPASLGLLTAAVAGGLLGRRRPRARG